MSAVSALTSFTFSYRFSAVRCYFAPDKGVGRFN